MSAGGKPGQVVKIDETTVEFQFDNPHYLFVELLAGDTLIGGGQSVRQSQGVTYGAYAPKHYLKQFLPKYSSEEAVNAQGQGRRLRELGEAPPLQEGLVVQPGAADDRAVEDGAPDQHADLGARAQSLLLGGRYRRQPACPTSIASFSRSPRTPR